VNGSDVFDCGVGANWFNPRGALPSPLEIAVGAADQQSANDTAAAAAFNCGTPPSSPYPTSWTIHRGSADVPLGETRGFSVRFDQHRGSEPFYDYRWLPYHSTILELVEPNPNDSTVFVRGKALGTTELRVRLLQMGTGTAVERSWFNGKADVRVGAAQPMPTPSGGGDPTGAAAAFLEVADVFHHPRCTNCHVAGTVPKSGDNRALHRVDGRNIRPQRGDNCVRCHATNPTTQGYDAPVRPATGLNLPWNMPPATMTFEDSAIMGGLKLPGDICRMIKANSGSPQAVVNHLRDDNLVAWSFAPDNGLMPAHPQGHAYFVSKMEQWANLGGGCPSDSGGWRASRS
jgi:hypothetical protein